MYSAEGRISNFSKIHEMPGDTGQVELKKQVLIEIILLN